MDQLQIALADLIFTTALLQEVDLGRYLREGSILGDEAGGDMCCQGIWWDRVSQDYKTWVQLSDLQPISCVILSWSLNHSELCPHK